MCVALRQTGDLWLSVGMHAGLDWGESFFVGVQSSGHRPWQPVLSSSFQGPTWLTGGTAFPDGSIFMLLSYGPSWRKFKTAKHVHATRRRS